MIILFLTDGTGGDGDSTNHFLYAKYAFKHPENFFNHWAKPMYVWLFAPIAQLGFTSVQVFNALLLIASTFLTYKIGEHLNIQSSLFPIIAIFATPMCIYWTLSGLTEPLFAFWLIVGIYLLFKEKTVFALIWLSFLPFVRSEGLIIFCVLTLYLLSKKQWKYIPLLSIGHIVLAILGARVHGKFDWVLTKIPYNNLDSSDGYGVGTWDHYLVHFYEISGPVLSILIGIGLLLGLYRLIKFWSGKSNFDKKELWLVYGIFVAFFLAHTIFWAVGMFNSYGLLRVFLGIAPISALLAARAIEPIYQFWNTKWTKMSFWYILIPLLVFNIFQKQSWKDLHLSSQQSAMKTFAAQYASEFENADYTLFIDYPDGLYMLQLDPFDKTHHRTTTDFLNSATVHDNTWLIWDYRFSVVDHQNPLEKFSSHPDLVAIDTLSDDKRAVAFVIFKRKPIYVDKENGLLFQEDLEESKLVGISHDGDNQVLKMQKDTSSFAPGLNVGTANLLNNSAIHYSFKAKSLSDNYSLSLVTSYEDLNGNTLDWKADKVNLNQANKWESISLKTNVQSDKFPNSQLKIYLWLQEGSVLIDDIQIAH